MDLTSEVPAVEIGGGSPSSEGSPPGSEGSPKSEGGPRLEGLGRAPFGLEDGLGVVGFDQGSVGGGWLF